MRARSALFDVYGDHLRSRGDQAPVSALIRLLEPVGIAEPAVRTAISRMAAQGWLEPARVDDAPGYRASPRAIGRLTEAAARIYRSAPAPWDGRWRMVFLDAPRHRGDRERLREELTYLGYAEHAPGVWLCPFEHPDVAEVIARAGGSARYGVAVGLDPDPLSAWDLARLATSYAAWPGVAGRLLAQEDGALTEGEGDPDERAFAARFRLVHEWRKFLFDDPGLPAELLPADWPGAGAAALFTHEASRLKPASERYVSRCLGRS
ncbi:MAG TPA: PaaX family transcriptional regulator C-terminal domain-containing protein [Nocardioides sp.]|jgi:phenylacetic acid degradation operon negative regulatory protein|uniref:PaaX family transcriptional regulator n=1 Tax=Nocardioides sp. TaxID=35761 RepID=UPI002E36CB93|nr:PaaX family transcriptional regulator C-terminal domain-containing protein [Nocardioides sp.]HEX3932898.1 PaaX family transcriptional regulator C-terminal domain-containing protein [Nocardioides sp.]